MSLTDLCTELRCSLDIPYVFGTFNRTPPKWPKIPDTEQEKRLSGAMLGCWTSFAKTGKPQAANEPEWPAYDAHNGLHHTSFGNHPPGSGQDRARTEAIGRSHSARHESCMGESRDRGCAPYGSPRIGRKAKMIAETLRYPLNFRCRRRVCRVCGLAR